MDNTQKDKQPYALLISALRRIESWLERDGASRIITAKPTIRQLRMQHLPAHVEARRKKRVGRRRAIRGRRNINEARPVLAVWPEDKMDESSLPLLACCMRGTVDFRIADYVLKVRAGDWVLFPAGIPKQDGNEAHFEDDSTERLGDILWIRSDIAYSNETRTWGCRSEGRNHSKLEELRSHIENHFLASLFSEFCEQMQEPGRAEVAQRILSLALFMARKEIESGNVLRKKMGLQTRASEDQFTPIAEALIYIDRHLHERLTIESVAAQIFVSPATFTRLFKKETGETFGQYQTKRRMDLATMLLETTNLTILHICQRIGLQYSQMNKLFHDKYGCSPSEYRTRKN